MKVFVVEIEKKSTGAKSSVTTVSYVTSKENTLLSVAKVYGRRCKKNGETLISVKEVLTINNHLET
jgi:hypothetical protein